MDRSCLQRDLPGSHDYLRGGQDWANLGRIPFARKPTGTGYQTPAWPVRRLAQSAQWACSPAHWTCQRSCTVAKIPGYTLTCSGTGQRPLAIKYFPQYIVIERCEKLLTVVACYGNIRAGLSATMVFCFARSRAKRGKSGEIPVLSRNCERGSSRARKPAIVWYRIIPSREGEWACCCPIPRFVL